MTIGARNDRGTVIAPFAGRIDDVRLYRRVLSDTDVRGLAAMGPREAGNSIILR